MAYQDFKTKYLNKKCGYPTDENFYGEYCDSLNKDLYLPYINKEVDMPSGIYIRTKDYKQRQHEGMLGHVVSDATKKKIADAQTGEKHWNWKGENVKYRRLHSWIVLKYGKANHCEFCGEKNAKMYDWANISKSYKRDISDYIQLCRKCHIKYDETPEKIILRRKCLSIRWNRGYANLQTI